MSRRTLPTLLLVTPYLATANNGNWRTAARWARLLSGSYRVIVQSADAAVVGDERDKAFAMIALHARRSRPSIAAWRAERPDRALIVALTGTDLYKDVLAGDTSASLSIDEADRLVVLQEDAVNFVPAEHRSKTDVVFQSARTLPPWSGKREPAVKGRLDCLLVAHLRPEKDPMTVFSAWRQLPPELPIDLTVIGEALDPSLGDASRALAIADPRVQWLGPRPHAWTRQAIKRAHVLLCPSQMEGGANVVVEALTASTAVVASRISGNLGMLGDNYLGYFPVGDAPALVDLLTRVWYEPQLYSALVSACQERSALFSPAAERAALLTSLSNALAANAGAGRVGSQDRGRRSRESRRG